MSRPSPFEWLIIWASGQAALTAAMAPLFGNDPTVEGVLGFAVGLIAGIPAYLIASHRRGRR